MVRLIVSGLAHAFLALVDASYVLHPRVLVLDAGRSRRWQTPTGSSRSRTCMMMSKHATSFSCMFRVCVPILVGVQPFAEFSESYVVLDVSGWMNSLATCASTSRRPSIATLWAQWRRCGLHRKCRGDWTGTPRLCSCRWPKSTTRAAADCKRSSCLRIETCRRCARLEMM